MFSTFLLGKITVNDSVREAMHRTPLDLIARHAIGEHGDISPRQEKQNKLSLRNGGEIRSEYLIDPTDASKGRVSVVTIEGWGETHVSLNQPKRRKKKTDGLPV